MEMLGDLLLHCCSDLRSITDGPYFPDKSLCAIVLHHRLAKLLMNSESLPNRGEVVVVPSLLARQACPAQQPFFQHVPVVHHEMDSKRARFDGILESLGLLQRPGEAVNEKARAAALHLLHALAQKRKRHTAVHNAPLPQCLPDDCASFAVPLCLVAEQLSSRARVEAPTVAARQYPLSAGPSLRCQPAYRPLAAAWPSQNEHNGLWQRGHTSKRSPRPCRSTEATCGQPSTSNCTSIYSASLA
mmetsp:Transcript_433/g.1508  ORF Transcript_433/g.1508 Transcript_433/m.1508 type:complete len:244 (-) Transcript_433:2350-3081(-)